MFFPASNMNNFTIKCCGVSFKIRWILKIPKCAEFLKWNLQIDDLDYFIQVTNNQFVGDSPWSDFTFINRMFFDYCACTRLFGEDPPS